MKQLLYIAVFLLATATTFSSCKKNTESLTSTMLASAKFDTLTFDHSMKGWELYSWQTGSKWKHSILVGTNAVKTILEVKNNPISIIGEDSLKSLLNKMPEGEEIFWIGKLWLENNWLTNYDNLELPPRVIQLDIKEFCETRVLKLTIEE